ncbi:hypothetical protein IOD13_02325 [Brevibacterium casei]|nr:hypothetical protein [Brevibacterium casei]
MRNLIVAFSLGTSLALSRSTERKRAQRRAVVAALAHRLPAHFPGRPGRNSL